MYAHVQDSHVFPTLFLGKSRTFRLQQPVLVLLLEVKVMLVDVSVTVLEVKPHDFWAETLTLAAINNSHDWGWFIPHKTMVIWSVHSLESN
jgi:hypothetical protein